MVKISEAYSRAKEGVGEMADGLSQKFERWKQGKLVLANLVVPGHPVWVNRDDAEVAHPKPLPDEFAQVAYDRLTEIARLRDQGTEEISEAGFRERWDIARKIAGDGSIAVINLARLLFPSQHERMGLRKALYDLSEHNSDRNVKKHLKKKFPFMVRAQSGDGRGTTFQDSATLEECLLDDEKFNKVLETESGQAMLYALLELLIDSKENAVVAGVAEAISEARSKLQDGITEEHVKDYGKWRRWFEKAYTGISIPAITGGTTMILSTLGVRNPALLAFLATTGASAVALGWFIFVSEVRRRALEGDITIREALSEMANGTGDEESKHWMDILQRNHLIRAFLIAVCLGEAGSNMIGGGNTTGVVVNATNTAVQGNRVTGAQRNLIERVQGNMDTMERELGAGWRGNAQKEAEGTGVSGRAGKKSVYEETVARGGEVMKATTQAKERLQDPLSQAKWERFRNQFGTAVTTVTAALFGNESITQAASDRLMSVQHSQRLYDIYLQQEAQVRQTNEAANQAVIGKSREKYGNANPEVLAKVSEVQLSFTKPEQHHRSTLRILSELFGPMFGWIAFLVLWAISNRLEMSTLLLTRKSKADRERGEEALEEFAATHGKDVDELTLEERTEALMKKDKKKKKKKILKKNSHAHVQLIQAPAAEELVEVTDTAVTLFATKLCELQEHANLAAVLPGVKLYDPEEMEEIINAQIDAIAFPHGGRLATWSRKTFGNTSVGYQPLEHAQARYAVFQKIMDDPELRGEFVTKALFHTDRLRAAKRAKDLEGMLRAMQNDWERRNSTGTTWGPNATRMETDLKTRMPIVRVPAGRSNGFREGPSSPPVTDGEGLDGRKPDGYEGEETPSTPLSAEDINLLRKNLAILRDIAKTREKPSALSDEAVWESYGAIQDVMDNDAHAEQFAEAVGEKGLPTDKVIDSIKRVLEIVAAVYEAEDEQEEEAQGLNGAREYTETDLQELELRVRNHAAAFTMGTLPKTQADQYRQANVLLDQISASRNHAEQQRLIGQLEEVVEELEAAAAKEQPGEPESAKKGVTLDAADRNMIKDFKQDAERIRRENPEDEEILGVVDSLEALVEDWEAEGGKAKRKELIQAMQSKDWWGILNRRPSRPESAKKGAELSEADRMFIAEFKRNAARVRGENERNSDIQAIVTGLEALVRVWETQGGQARKNAVIDEMRRWKWQRILDGDIPVEESGEQPKPAAKNPRSTVRTDLGDGDMEEKRAAIREDAEKFIAFADANIDPKNLPTGQKSPFTFLVRKNVLGIVDSDPSEAQKALAQLIRQAKENYGVDFQPH